MSSYASDPLLMQIRARAQADLHAAQAQALKEQKDLLLNLGDPGLVKSMFGVKHPKTGDLWLDAILKSRNVTDREKRQRMAEHGWVFKGKKGTKLFGKKQGEKAFLASVLGNPSSQLGSLERDYQLARDQAEETYSAGNLFYGGARAKGLTGLLEGRNTQQAGFMRGAQQELSGIARQLLEARKQYRTQMSQAETEAYYQDIARQVGGF